MLCTAASLLLIELAVVYAELRVSDILSAELLPSTLLLEGNVTRRNFKRRSPVGIPEVLKRRPGNWSQAFSTMEFHRKMMNEFLCRNYVAEQILDDMSSAGESLTSAWSSPLKSSGPVKKAAEPDLPTLPDNTTETETIAEDRMDRNISSNEKPPDESVSSDNPPDEPVDSDPPDPRLTESRSAPMFRKKSSASLKKTRKKKKKHERGSRRRTDVTKPNMLADSGSAAYKDWLTRTALLEDIYRHYDHLAVPSEESSVPSPAPVEENVSEETSATNTGMAVNLASASDAISPSTSGQSLANLAGFEGGEVTGYAVTQGASYPAMASPPSPATLAAAAAAAAANQGAAGILRPISHANPSATGPISAATNVKGLSAIASPSLLATSTFPSYGAKFPMGAFSFPGSVPSFSGPLPGFTGSLPGASGSLPAGFPGLSGSLPAGFSGSIPGLSGFSGFSGSPGLTTIQTQPSLPTGVPTAAYGDRGGAFSHASIDPHTEYELHDETGPDEEYHHHHHVEHEHKGHGKLLSLEDLFDLVLTAIAFLAFGAFVVHLIMCLLNSEKSSYVPMMEVPVTAPGPVPSPAAGAGAASMGAGRRRRRRRRRDAVSGEAGVVLDGLAPAALDRAAASVITSIDAALAHVREREQSEFARSECLLRALCAHNRRSRSAPGMLRVWMPVWSLGLSWVVGRNTTYPASSTLSNLRASLLGLSGTRCRSAFPKCKLTSPTSQPTPSTGHSPKQPTKSAPSSRQPAPVIQSHKSTLNLRPSKPITIQPPSQTNTPIVTDRNPVGPPGVGGYTHFTPIAIKSNRRAGVQKRRKKP